MTRKYGLSSRLRQRIHKPLFVYGRIDRGANLSHPIKDYLIEARFGRGTLEKTSTDSSGRFLIEWDNANPPPSNSRLVVRAYTPWQTAAGVRELLGSELKSPRTLVFKSFKPPAYYVKRGGDNIGASHPNGILIEKFEADGDWPIRVESSCHAVRLSWSVKVPRGNGSQVSARVELLEGSKIISKNLPLESAIEVKSERSRAYALVVTHRKDGQNLRNSRLVIVKRFPTLSLYLEGSLAANSRIPAGVQLSCPSPRGGVRVTINSSNPGVIRGGELFIRPRRVGSVIQLRSGPKEGYAEITALADGYLSDTVKVVTLEKGSSTLPRPTPGRK